MLDLSPDQLLTTTRAVRRRLDFDRPVPREVVERCVEIALQAPTGSNMTLWRWVVLDDPETVGKAARVYTDAMELQLAQPDASLGGAEKVEGYDRLIASARHLAENLHRCPVLALPLLRGRTEGVSLFRAATLWGSILPAVWSFMLALRARGLGSAWTTVHLDLEKQMADLLDIPMDRYTQVGLFPVAYTRGTDFRPGPRPPVSQILSWNRLG